MSKVKQLTPTIRAQRQRNQMVVSKTKMFRYSDDANSRSWHTGPNLCQETAMIDFALVWLCGRRQTESLPVCVVQGKRQNITSPGTYDEFDLSHFEIFVWVAWPVLSTVQCYRACQAGHETLCAFPQSRYPYLSSPHCLPSKYLSWFPEKIAEAYEVYVDISNLRFPREGINKWVQKVWLNHLRPNMKLRKDFIESVQTIPNMSPNISACFCSSFSRFHSTQFHPKAPLLDCGRSLELKGRGRRRSGGEWCGESHGTRVTKSLTHRWHIVHPVTLFSLEVSTCPCFMCIHVHSFRALCWMWINDHIVMLDKTWQNEPMWSKQISSNILDWISSQLEMDREIGGDQR